MKDQIQQLVAEGRTEDALALLAKYSNDALLLQARFNNGKKQYNMGLIEFGEWQRTQAQINYAALEMANSIKENAPAQNAGGQAAQAPAAPAQEGQTQASVFISYNHNDSFAMRSVKGYLEDHGIKVFVDIFEMKVGEDIQEFIDKALKDNTIILSLISKNSLISGWVNVEITSAILLRKFGSKWLPARLDDACYDDDFFFDTLKHFDEQLEKKSANIRRALDNKVDTRAFQEEHSRLTDAKSNFSKLIEVLKQTKVEDISEKMFDGGMAKIVSAIKS